MILFLFIVAFFEIFLFMAAVSSLSKILVNDFTIHNRLILKLNSYASTNISIDQHDKEEFHGNRRCFCKGNYSNE